METSPREGVMEEKFPNTRKHSIGGCVGSFGISEDNITGRKKKKTPQNTRLTATPSREVAQTLPSAGSEQGLNKEVWVAYLG